MEIINKTHEEITVAKRVGLDVYIRLQDKARLFISAGACRLYGITEVLKLNLINDENEWMIYFDDNADGFDMIPRKNRDDLYVANSALVNLFIKRTKCSLPCKFPLTLMDTKYQGKNLIKIEINKPFEITTRA